VATIDKDLVRNINKGTCLLLVGAGTSADVGFPSWASLVDIVQETLTISGKLSPKSIKLIELYKANNDYLNCFEEIAKEVGKKLLVDEIKIIFDSVSKKNSEVNSYITKWPFQFYLTTNYDSVLSEYLNREGVTAVERGNSLDDFRILHMNTRDAIFRIHGDFSNFETMILTKSDYDSIRNDKKFDYWRERIFSVLNMCNILIIGYSARDPNFIDQVERAKQIADPNKPVFMFAADIDAKTTRKLYEQNIRILRYDNIDGKHSGLKRLLKQYDHFLQKRNGRLIGVPEVDQKEAEIASSLYFYNEVVLKDISIIEKALYNIILNKLKERGTLHISEVKKALEDSKILYDEISCKNALGGMIAANYIKYNGDTVELTAIGHETVLNAKAGSDDIRSRFLIYCHTFLVNLGLAISSIDKIIAQIQNGLVSAFKKRGFEIANMIFGGKVVSLNTSTDFLDELEKYSSIFEQEEYICFAELILEILQRPSKEAKDYLAILANGYFVYHILGHDAESRAKRLDVLKNKELFIDSSILIPFMAKYCVNYDFAQALVSELKAIGIKLIVTNKLLRELSVHAEWALRNFRNTRFDDLDFYAAGVGISCRQNLFIDGAMKWSLGKSVSTFGDYMSEIFGSDNPNGFVKIFTEKVRENGIIIIDMDEIPGFEAKHYEDYEIAKSQIKENRIKHETYKSDQQCETEAELVVISSIRPFNFLTHSNNLKALTLKRDILHWPPETMYRFLNLNKKNVELSNLYDCMIGDFYSYGFNVINTDVLKAFSGPFFSQARMELAEQKRELGNVLDKFLTEEEIRYQSEDFTLPFYPLQTETYAARELKKANAIASIRISELEKIKKMTESERAEYLKMKSKKESRKKKAKRRRNGKKKK
jgi:hypothetical protein